MPVVTKFMRPVALGAVAESGWFTTCRFKGLPVGDTRSLLWQRSAVGY